MATVCLQLGWNNGKMFIDAQVKHDTYADHVGHEYTNVYISRVRAKGIVYRCVVGKPSKQKPHTVWSMESLEEHKPLAICIRTYTALCKTRPKALVNQL